MRGLIYIALIFFLGGCTKYLSSDKDILQWVTDPSNGLVQNKQNGPMVIDMKYMPKEYFAYNELSKGNTQSDFDSILKTYGRSVNFILTLSLKNEKGEDVDLLFGSSADVEEYKTKIHDLNFSLAEFISMKYKGGELRPALVRMEDAYGLSASRKFFIAFTPADSLQQKALDESEELKVTFDDPAFNSGISNFVFKTEDIKNIPPFKPSINEGV
ncbi:MAG: hypothetical protein ACKOXB_12435 [Flavobacteriales bacterium]